VPAALDVPHSWTSIADVAKTLVMVATREQAWGQAWLVPTNPALTVRELATRFAILRGLPAPKLTTVPYAALWAAGLFSPLMRELRATNYQWTRLFLLTHVTEQTSGLTRTPIDMALAAIPSANPIPARR
jgi:nucleoside-diphosphate-sugar epimerase